MLPDHTRRLLERLLGAYCERICPPRFGGGVDLGFRIEADGATLYERRRICGVPGTLRPAAVARLRYAPQRGEWRLYAAAGDAAAGRWRRHPRVAPARSVARLLGEIDADRDGLFWPRLNGASLRWCSSRGRCADCALRYRAILGVS